MARFPSRILLPTLLLSLTLLNGTPDVAAQTSPATPVTPAAPALPTTSPLSSAPTAPRATDVAVLQVPALFQEQPTRATIAALAQEVYARYQDEADFIFMLDNRSAAERPEDLVYGVLFHFRNETKGLGLSLFDLGAESGSAVRLQSVIYLSYREGLRKGPSLHEFVHRWANYAVPTTETGHYGFSSAGLQIGGFEDRTLEVLGDGQYRAGVGTRTWFGSNANSGNSVPYSELELYMMGLLPPTDVKPFHVATQAEFVDFDRGVFRASAMTPWTIDDVILKVGPRVPTYENAQKRFTMLVVLLTDRPATPEEQLEVATGARWLTRPGPDDEVDRYNFYEATRGKGQLDLLDPTSIQKP